MKKTLLVLILFFSVRVSASQVQTLTITTQAMATQYGWSDLQCLRHFALNEALSVDVDSAGTMKYTANTRQMHCYQWLGGFTIKAQDGCTIRKVKLTYFSVNSGVLTQHWGATGKSIPEADRIASNQEIEVNGSEVKLYVGTTGTNTDGQVRLEKWEVEYVQPTSNEVMMRSAVDLARQYGWADGYCPVHITFNSALSFHSDQNNNVKYYSTSQAFHCYQWCGGFYFKSRPGTLIKSVVLTYESLNNAVLTQNWGADGRNIPEDDWIKSGAIVPVNGDSVHFYTGDKSSSNNCQLHITSFSVVYVDSISTMETFALCPTASSNDSVEVKGDHGLYRWQLSKFQRSSSDLVYGSQATRLLCEGAIASEGETEGGIKDVSFEWRSAADDGSVLFFVKVAGVTDTIRRTNPGSRYVMNYTKEFAMKRNCAIAVGAGSSDSPAPVDPIIGPVTITPYLLFKVPDHTDSIDTNLSSYDLRPKLINNTNQTPVYEVVSNTTGDEVAIRQGVVDLSKISHAGDVQVKASCWGGDVFTTLTLHVEVAPRVAFAVSNMVVDIQDAPFVNPLSVPDSIGKITYFTSDTQVVVVNDTGLVTIRGIGQAFVTAHIAASKKYAATSTSFGVSVTYTPELGTYRAETFSGCRKKKVSEGFAYVVGDDAVYDWNLANFSRDAEDTIMDTQGILLNYGGMIASNGVQEGGVKYLAFDWRAVSTILPVHFFVNLGDMSQSYRAEAVGDASMVYTYNLMPNIRSNTTLSINVRAKESPAQSQIVAGSLLIMPYLLFTNKYVELELPQTSYDCAEDLINNTEGEGEVSYAIVSSLSGKATIEGSVLDWSAVSGEDEILVKATWGEVSTTMTVHVAVPTGLEENVNANINRKVIKDGELLIYRGGGWYTVLGNKK